MHEPLVAACGVPQQLSWLREPAARKEVALLREPQMVAWAGFKLGIFQATSVEIRGQQGEHPALGMILRGRTRARIRSRGQECDFSPGRDSVGVFAPQLDVDWTRWDCEPGAERMMVELDFSELESAGDLETLLPARRQLRQDLTLSDPGLASIMRLIAAEVREGSPHGALYATSLCLSLASYLFAEHARGGRMRPRERGRLTAAQRARVLQLIQERLAEDLTLEELAAAAGISRSHFARLFKSTMGVTPHQFVLDQRIAEARRLLEGTLMPLVDIAASTGFASQSHLCSAMRRHLGFPPGQWRRLSMSSERG